MFSSYLDCASYYINYQGKLRNVEDPLNNKEFYQEWAAPFYKGAMYFVNYVENTYTDEVLASDTPRPHHFTDYP